MDDILNLMKSDNYLNPPTPTLTASPPESLNLAAVP